MTYNLIKRNNLYIINRSGANVYDPPSIYGTGSSTYIGIGMLVGKDGRMLLSDGAAVSVSASAHDLHCVIEITINGDKKYYNGGGYYKLYDRYNKIEVSLRNLMDYSTSPYVVVLVSPRLGNNVSKKTDINGTVYFFASIDDGGRVYVS